MRHQGILGPFGEYEKLYDSCYTKIRKRGASPVTRSTC